MQRGAGGFSFGCEGKVDLYGTDVVGGDIPNRQPHRHCGCWDIELRWNAIDRFVPGFREKIFVFLSGSLDEAIQQLPFGVKSCRCQFQCGIAGCHGVIDFIRLQLDRSQRLVLPVLAALTTTLTALPA